jgi:hypothetical protein
MRFRRHDEALIYLRHWARDTAAMFALRAALREALRSAPLYALSDEQVLDVLAACLVDGTVAIAAAALPAAEGPGDVALAFAQPAASPAASPAPAPPAAAPPVAAQQPADDVLEALEEVQIEGAEVRPEIEQALVELDATMGNVDLASVSLAPTPTKVDAISASMTETSAGVVQTIDDL